MLDPWVNYVSAAILLSGSVIYTIDTLRGKAKPNRVSWLLWGLAPMLALAAQISNGIGTEALVTFAIGFGPLMVLAASFINRSAYWQISRFDLACGALSLLALVLWAITGQGLVALVLSIAADFAAALPTVAKAYEHPETESAGGFWPAIPAGILTLLTIDTWAFNNYAVVAYILIINLVIATLISWPRLRFGARG